MVNDFPLMIVQYISIAVTV